MLRASKKLWLGLFFAGLFLLTGFFAFTPDASAATQCKCTGGPIQFSRPSANSCQTICSYVKAGIGKWDAASSNCVCSGDSADFWFASDNKNCKDVCLKTHNSFECPDCAATNCACQAPGGITWIERSKCTGTKEFSAEANETCKLKCRLFPPPGYSGDVLAITGKCPAYTTPPKKPLFDETKFIFDETKFIKPSLEINIPQLTFADISNTLDSEGNIYLPWIGEYISAVYRFAMVAISIMAVIMIIIQGVRISASGGKDVAASYKKIGTAMVGLLIAWGSYAILYNINPELVKFKALKIKYIETTPLPPNTGLQGLSEGEIAGVTNESAAAGEALCKTPEECVAVCHAGGCGVTSQDCSPSAMQGLEPEAVADKCKMQCSTENNWPTPSTLQSLSNLAPALSILKSLQLSRNNIKATPQVIQGLTRLNNILSSEYPNYAVSINNCYRDYKADIRLACKFFIAGEAMAKAGDNALAQKLYSQVPKFVSWPGGSPHASGYACDVNFIRDGKPVLNTNSSGQCNNSPDNVAKLLEIMTKSGAKRYVNEVWHFEWGSPITNARCVFPNCPWPIPVCGKKI